MGIETPGVAVGSNVQLGLRSFPPGAMNTWPAVVITLLASVSCPLPVAWPQRIRPLAP